MDRIILLLLAGIIAGFALIAVPLAGTFLAGLASIITLIGIIAVVLFSLILIIKVLIALLDKKKHHRH
ncbi:hypothetical protein E2R51_00485 [Jeotgalibacillus sp. S-D1]|uniref:hypothetical protein n=1 Tax=Jeotgalibacillus sp. S-D1 TaxID=2552189 RepID=UPI00105A491C|nr:hypothetical protein [Jeotgalibacillus sp. S-D1]TDL34228.1 hypothetical protein E2R51_00485 [Jeotgalibacillus sp. S-D1]